MFLIISRRCRPLLSCSKILFLPFSHAADRRCIGGLVLRRSRLNFSSLPSHRCGSVGPLRFATSGSLRCASSSTIPARFRVAFARPLRCATLAASNIGQGGPMLFGRSCLCGMDATGTRFRHHSSQMRRSCNYLIELSTSSNFHYHHDASHLGSSWYRMREILPPRRYVASPLTYSDYDHSPAERVQHAQTSILTGRCACRSSFLCDLLK